jgi:enoyl-CoA hydratase/carnithine racemase
MATSPEPTFRHLTITRSSPPPSCSDAGIFIITLSKPPENRLNSAFCTELIQAFNHIQKQLEPLPSSSSSTTTPPFSAGAVITRGSDAKFWSTGIELEEAETNPYANSEGFFPLLHRILDFPFPTIALLSGHTFGGAVPLALAHDYRVMNSKRGYLSMVSPASLYYSPSRNLFHVSYSRNNNVFFSLSLSLSLSPPPGRVSLDT